MRKSASGRFCTHTEAVVNDVCGRETHLAGDRHDCAYVEARKALIEKASCAADGVAGLPEPAANDPIQNRQEWNHRWNRAFHEAMETFWAAR